jgi:hypothetical protein
MFLGALASAALVTANIDQMDVVTTRRVAAISGDQIADASGWVCSRSGENKSSSQPSSAKWISTATITNSRSNLTKFC